MSAAGQHSVFLQANGTVKSCGQNNLGQCGTGDITSPKLEITTIPGLTDVVQTSVGMDFSLFLLSDGTVKSCGSNAKGQCGTGDTVSPKLEITTIPGLTDVVQIATGAAFSLFLLSDGTVKSCGINNQGQLGMGNVVTPKLAITAIPGLTDVVYMSAGNYNSLFVLKDGTVKSCGGNDKGQSGTGNTTTPKLSLTVIPGLTNVIKSASCSTTSFFLLADGTVKSCGDNTFGQCGTGSPSATKLAVSLIAGLTNVTSIATGYGNVLFLLSDGTVKSCGYNGSGQCGTGDVVTPKLTVSLIPELTNVKQISANGWASFFLLMDNVINTCGQNTHGQCATEDAISPKLTLALNTNLTSTNLQNSGVSILPILSLSDEEKSDRLKAFYLFLSKLPSMKI